MRRIAKIAAASLLSLVVLIGAGLIVAYLVLSGGPVTSEQLRERVQTQISALLGDRLQASVRSASLALGQGGLFAVKAEGVTVLTPEGLNLGVAETVRVAVKPGPLLNGRIEARHIEIDGTKLSISPLAAQLSRSGGDAEALFDWSGSADIAYGLEQLAKGLRDASLTVSRTGLQEIRLNRVELIGFDQLGLRMRSAWFEELVISDGKEAGSELTIDGRLANEKSAVTLEGRWHEADPQTRRLDVRIAGLTMEDVLVSREAEASGFVDMDSALDIRANLPFDADLHPQLGAITVDVAQGRFNLGTELRSQLSPTRLNFAVLPDKNQIDLESSPVRFLRTSAVLSGGVRFSGGTSARPLFELLANEIEAHSMASTASGAAGAMRISGSLDRQGRRIVADKLLLKTPSGEMSGQSQIDLSGDVAQFSLSLATKRMDIVHLKQFWPAVIAPQAHRWADGGIRDGAIEEASLTMALPLREIWTDTPLTPQQLSIRLPIVGATVATTGDLPAIEEARGDVRISGTTTSVVLSHGRLDSGSGPVKVDSGSLILQGGTKGSLPADLALKLSGSVSAVARLGTLEPLDFTKRLGLQPQDLSGSVDAAITTSFDIAKGFQADQNRWGARVQIADGASKAAINGRKVREAQLVIEASQQLAIVKGSATVDGLSAELDMVEPLGETTQPRQRLVKFNLDEADMRRLGIDTGGIVSGRVGVTISSDGQSAGSGQLVEADLTEARLDFPWIGWTKGRGIGASAKFILRSSDGSTVLDQFSLEGDGGFRARGTIRAGKAGLQSARLNKVRLNPADDFDVSVDRTGSGFRVAVNARSYDGRGLIRKFLNNTTSEAGSGITVEIAGSINQLIGFNNQRLTKVFVEFAQRGSRILRARVNALAAGGDTRFDLLPVPGGMQTSITSQNAGTVLGFLDLYEKVQGGRMSAQLLRDASKMFRGTVEAFDFTLLDEPRLAQLLRPPPSPNSNTQDRLSNEVRKLPQFRNDRAQVDQMRADIVKGPGLFQISRGRMQGGDASAAFEGTVYDQRNRMDIRGTFLPGRGLNRLVSNIPLLGLAFGSGKTTGLLGITFRLSGPYGNPQIAVNPLSVIAPGVFRRLFQF
ncbi:MAG: DUF3971 domain-containing protein [Ahrensia sp.]|nr:DUF3971 domain-containing protein [Ahrensia sp.]